jgi:hypothetical protein
MVEVLIDLEPARMQLMTRVARRANAAGHSDDDVSGL